MYIIFKQ